MKPRDCDVNISSKAKSMLEYISTTIQDKIKPEAIMQNLQKNKEILVDKIE